MSIDVMKQAWEAEQKANPHTAYNSWCRGYEAALRTAIEQAEKCQRDNPLGGPAKVFDAMANSIRAGDDYHQVLRQYGFVEAAPVQEQFGPQEILQMIVDRALEKSAAQRQWVSLTDEEIDKTHETQVWDARRSYARAIEVKLREKNTGETK